MRKFFIKQNSGVSLQNSVGILSKKADSTALGMNEHLDSDQSNGNISGFAPEFFFNLFIKKDRFKTGLRRATLTPASGAEEFLSHKALRYPTRKWRGCI